MEEFLTLEEVSQRLKVSKMTIYRYIKAWKIVAYKLWKELRIKKNDYDSFLEKSKFISSNLK
jgi:excisionase family DNA binding protein